MDDSMNGFHQRKKAFEAKYLHDEELSFRISAKRNSLFSLWAAALLGCTGEKAAAYSEEILLIEVQKTHNDDALHKVLRDLEAGKVQISEHRVRREFEKSWLRAEKIIMNDEER